MTRETARKFRKEINAFGDGEVILTLTAGGHWVEDSNPAWSDFGEYRIKPKPRTFWVNVYEDRARAALHDSEYLAKQFAGEGAETIQVIEVL